MFHTVMQKCLKRIYHDTFVSINRCYTIPLKGIIPGGGLGKLQGIKEEEYFSRQDHKKCKNMKEKAENIQLNNIDCFPPEETELKKKSKLSSHHKCSIKHKDLLEESYFLTENCDSIQVLKSKKHKDD